MNEVFLYVSFFGLVMIFFFMLLGLVFKTDNPNSLFSRLNDWRFVFVLLAASYLFWFLYYNTTIGLVQLTQTISVASIDYELSNNYYIIFVNFMGFMNAFLVLIHAFAFKYIAQNIRFKGRERMQ